MAKLEKEAELKFYHENYEHHFKGANYLMVANAAGFVGCITVLRDYATTPAYKGVGFYIVVFGIGMLSSILYYIGLALARSNALSTIIQDRYMHEPTQKFLTVWHFVTMTISILALVIAIVGLMTRLAKL